MENKIEIIHEHLLKSLKAFHAFCEDHEIEYTLHGGSLLGAIRERGFIPWDDDADIAMMRGEYERLVKAIDQSHSPMFILENTLLNKTGTCTRLRLNQNGQSKDIAWIDIFIYDYISEKKLIQKTKIQGSIFLNRLVRGGANTEKTGLKRIMILFTCALGKAIPIQAKNKIQLWFERDALIGRKEYIYRSNDQYKGLILILPAKTMSRFETIKFENIELKITSDYDCVLRSSYGDDYMIPKKYTTGEVLQHSRVRETVR